MFDIDKWTEIIATIMQNKLRTFLTILGVFWGILMLVLLLGSSTGLKNGVDNTFNGFAVNSIYIWPQETTLPYKGLKPGRYYTFRNDDIDVIKAHVPEVGILAPRIQLGGWRDANNVVRNNKYGNFQVMGDYPEYRYIEVMKIENGRYINNLDMQDKRKVCVIGEQVRQELFAENENPVGDYIKIKGVHFLVVGVFQSLKGWGEEADRDERTVYIPFSTFQQAFSYGDKLSWFALTAIPGIQAEQVEKLVKVALSAHHTISPDDEQAIGSFNAQEEAQKFLGLFIAIRIFVWVAGLVTLLAGVIGVSNIMLIVVNERTKEIGIRKALGATPASIIFMIMQEAVFLTFFAGYTGLAIGVAALEAINYAFVAFNLNTQFFINPHIDFSTAMLATSILIVAGALAGLIPAMKAIRIDPIRALRSE